MLGSPKTTRTRHFLWVTVAALCAASLTAHAIERLAGDSRAATSLRLILDVDDERNVPTWFSSALLLLVAASLWRIGTAWRGLGRAHAWRWSMLALAALSMSAEEVVGLHERTIIPLRTALGTAGPLYYAWVIPGAALAACVGALSLRLILSLDRVDRNRFLCAGGVYLVGAIGFEMIGGVFAPPEGALRSAGYLVLTTIEEALEMAGLVLALGAAARLEAGLDSASGPQLRVHSPMTDERRRAG